jgi:hypothetical protein
MKKNLIKKKLIKQELFKTYWYFYFRLQKKPNLKKLQELINQAKFFKLKYNL